MPVKFLALAVVALASTGFFLAGAPSRNVEDYDRASSRAPLMPIVQHASVLFGGDMMFDRSIRVAMEEHGEDYIFSCLRDLLEGADLVVANLEGPITFNQSKSVGTVVGEEANYVFTFPTSTASLLFRHNIRLVNIGNNHITNFGREGLTETLKWLRGAGVSYFGDPINATVAYESANGVRLAFISYNEFRFPDHSGVLKNIGMKGYVLEHVRVARARGYLPVVYTHWGEEYADVSSKQRSLAREFIEAGAELVLGSHPHIVQAGELYRGKLIYYSLGNFIFDQYWDERVRRGLLLRIVFTPTGVASVEEIPIDNQIDRPTCAV